MTVDPQFEADREKVSKENGVAVWGPADPPKKHDIHGTRVVVDFNICLANGAYLEGCPVDMFMWIDTPGHPGSDVKAEPVHEDQCIDCMLCVDVCPVDATDVDSGRARRI